MKKFTLGRVENLEFGQPFWLFFIKDPSTGEISCSGYSHNAIADYRGNRYFIGMKEIKIDLGDLKK